MSILLRRIAALSALLALTLCLPQGSLLVCVSEDGHLALEAACDPKADLAHADTHAAEVADHCECAGECGPCSDARFGTELTASRVRDDSAPASAMLPAPAPASALLAALLAPLPPARAASPLAATGPPPAPYALTAAGACLRI